MSTFISHAIANFHAGNLDMAGRLCRMAVAEQPGYAAAYNLLGVCLFRAGHALESAPMFRRTLSLQPDFPDVLNNLSIVLHRGGSSEAARKCLQRLLSVHPGASAGADRLAAILHESGDLDGAIRWLRRAVILAPAEVHLRTNLAANCQAGGRLSVAIGHLRCALGLDPGNPNAFNQIGAVLLAVGDVVGALAAYSRALALEPGNFDARCGVDRSRCYTAMTRAVVDPGLAPGLVVRGPLTTVSGYGHMSCRLLQGLLGRGRRVQTVGLFGPESWPNTGAAVRSRIALHCLIPTAVEPIPGMRTAVFSMFEGPVIPAAWKRYSDRHDLVIVPTRSSRDAWCAQGFSPDRIVVCPLGVDDVSLSGPVLQVTDRRGRPISAYRTRVLNISDFVARKNLDGLLRVWLTGTRADDDAVLILKLGKGSAAARQGIEAALRRTEEVVGRSLSQAASVAVIDQRLSDEEMDGLYRASTHYWSLSHGEGWDLPLTRAGVFGLGLIAPRHSAYEDYLHPGVARLIAAGTGPAYEPYSQRYYVPFHGLEWWMPDENAAAEAISELVSGRAAPYPNARSWLLERFSWDRSVSRLCTVLDAMAM